MYTKILFYKTLKIPKNLEIRKLKTFETNLVFSIPVKR